MSEDASDQIVEFSSKGQGTDWIVRLRWFAAEILIVICGVLIALALNTWRSNSLHRQFERDLYTDIISEFETNLSILETDIATNDSTYLILTSLNDLSDAELMALPSGELTSRFGRWIIIAGFDPKIGIVQALVETANVGSLSDRGLRVLLSRWTALLEEKRRFGLQVFEYFNHNASPFVARATADLIWTEAERRELQSIYRTLSRFQALQMENQRRLQSTALDVRDYLQGLQ